MRLFTAIYPSAAALKSLDLALAGVSGLALSDPGPGLRWVPREQRHVTLSFHGNVPEGAVFDYAGELARQLREFVEFDLALAGAGTFSGRTLFCGIGTGIERVRRLSSLVNDAAENSGIRPDNRAGGRPHLTLVRASSSRGERQGRKRPARRGNHRPDLSDELVTQPSALSPLDAWARALAVYQGTPWECGEVSIVASQLGTGPHGGPQHQTLETIPLAKY